MKNPELNEHTERILLAITNALRHRLQESHQTSIQFLLTSKGIYIGQRTVFKRLLGVIPFKHAKTVFTAQAKGLWAEIRLKETRFSFDFRDVLRASANVHRVTIHLCIEQEDGKTEQEAFTPSLRLA